VPGESGFQEIFRLNSCLFLDRSKRPFRHVTGMVGDCSVAIYPLVEPDFVASGSLTVKLKSARL
jgi:hypothetical protein